MAPTERPDHCRAAGRAQPADGHAEGVSASAGSPGDAITLRKAMAISVAVASAAFMVGVGFGTWLMTGQLITSLGVGVFCAIWGGPGFGLMAGGAVYTLGQERAARTRSSGGALR